MSFPFTKLKPLYIISQTCNMSFTFPDSLNYIPYYVFLILNLYPFPASYQNHWMRAIFQMESILVQQPTSIWQIACPRSSPKRASALLPWPTTSLSQSGLIPSECVRSPREIIQPLKSLPQRLSWRTRRTEVRLRTYLLTYSCFRWTTTTC